MSRPIITLTTDFGEGSAYVGAMRGVILSICPDARVVDISHAVPAQNVAAGARILHQTARWFPDQTIHVAVVDPGVGTTRAIVYAEIGAHRFIAPDNGLLSRLAEERPPTKIVHVSNPEHWLPRVSATFHGRDIMAPVAARLAAGLPPDALGPTMERLIHLDAPKPHQTPGSVEGEVVVVDSFGNLVTNITRTMLEAAPSNDAIVVHCDGHETHGLFATYAEQPPMTLVAVIGSSDELELAIVNDSAAMMLGVTVGTPVRVTW